MTGSTNSEFCTVGKYLSEKAPMIHQRRTIDSFVLIYGVSKTLYISDGGREYSVSPDDYIILAAGREHFGTRESAAGISYYWCHFYIRGEYSVTGGEREVLTFGESGAFSLPMYGHCNKGARLHLLFHQLMDSSRTPSPYSPHICHSLLDVILLELASLCAEKSPAGDRRDATAANIVEWIRINAADLRGVGDVARYFGYNSEYLSTLLKSATGKSTVGHINESRILLARELLRTTDAKLSEIAERCGFSDEKYFSRLFKKISDVAPGEYRKAYRRQHLNSK